MLVNLVNLVNPVNLVNLVYQIAKNLHLALQQASYENWTLNVQKRVPNLQTPTFKKGPPTMLGAPTFETEP